MFTYLVQTVNNMYQNVSGKSIENQELILRVFFAVPKDYAYMYVLEFYGMGTCTCVNAGCTPCREREREGWVASVDMCWYSRRIAALWDACRVQDTLPRMRNTWMSSCNHAWVPI